MPSTLPDAFFSCFVKCRSCEWVCSLCLARSSPRFDFDLQEKMSWNVESPERQSSPSVWEKMYLQQRTRQRSLEVFGVPSWRKRRYRLRKTDHEERWSLPGIFKIRLVRIRDRMSAPWRNLSIAEVLVRQQWTERCDTKGNCSRVARRQEWTIGQWRDTAKVRWNGRLCCKVGLRSPRAMISHSFELVSVFSPDQRKC